MKRVEEVLGRIAATIVEASYTHIALTLGASVLLTVASLFAAATMLKVDTDSSRLLSEDMPVGRTNRALVELFPSLQDNIVVMIEADDADDARDVAIEVRDLLARETDRYLEVFLPGYGDYYDDFGIYYLEREELDDLAARIEGTGELLATLADRNELPILLGALSHVIASDQGIDSLGDEGRRILEEVARTIRNFSKGERAPIDWDELLFEEVDEGHTSPQLVFVKPVGDLTELEPVLMAVQHIRGLVPRLEDRPGLRVRVTGDRATHAEEMSLIIQEVAAAGGASLFLVALVLFYCLRSLRLVLAIVLTLLAGLTWTAGLAAVAVGQLNALTSAFAVLYIGLGVDFGIHFALDYLDRRDGGANVGDALRTTGSNVGSSLFLCAITTAIGFYAFIPTDYSAVADMGIISGTSVFLGLLATLTFFPTLIALGLGESPHGSSSLLHRIEIAPPRFPIHYPRTVCGLAALITLACSAAAFSVRFEFSTLKVRDPRVESVRALEDLLHDPELSVWNVDVITQDLEEATALAAQLERLEGVEEVRTPLGFLPDNQAERLEIFRNMRADLLTPVELTDVESGAKLDRMQAVEYTIEGYSVALDIDEELRGDVGAGDPILNAAHSLRIALYELLGRIRSGEVTDARLDALESDVFGDLKGVLEDVVEALPNRAVNIDDLPADLMSRYVAADGRVRVEVLSDANLNDRGELERFSDLIHAVRPDAGGPVPGAIALGRAMISSQREALVTAVVVIALGLLLLWRSIKYTLFTLAPLVIGSVGTAAVSVLADVPFNFANVIVLPLILGIGVDSGIHLVHRHRSGLGDASDLLSTTTARAVLFSALTTLTSFATLAFSNHLGISSLAKLLCVGILLMLLSNVIVLPAILAWLDETPESDRPGGRP
ncbi:MAG: MMPL family transporter [Deltaproteobacteria bacterium]|nr:MMPL family transporter [Deltaproteobacteria bacterium]